MRSALVLIASLFALPVLALPQDAAGPVERYADTVREHQAAQKAARQMRQRALAERFRHREARIRDAVARGDMTEAEAARLRARLEERRAKIQWLREQRRARMEAQRARALPADDHEPARGMTTP